MYKVGLPIAQLLAVVLGKRKVILVLLSSFLG
jgi:hypothetical protein